MDSFASHQDDQPGKKSAPNPPLDSTVTKDRGVNSATTAATSSTDRDGQSDSYPSFESFFDRPYVHICDHKRFLIVFMVGLPGCGKSFLAQRLNRFLHWLGYNCKVFNLGVYRRQLVESHPDADFFNPQNQTGNSARDKLALQALQDILNYFSTEDGNCALFDATNTTLERRKMLRDALRKNPLMPDIHVMWLESICDDQTIINTTIEATKRFSPDYEGKGAEFIRQDFLRRIHNYSLVYTPMSPDELSIGDGYIRIYNAGQRVSTHMIHGFLPTRLYFFILNTQLLSAPVYLMNCDEVHHSLREHWARHVFRIATTGMCEYKPPNASPWERPVLEDPLQCQYIMKIISPYLSSSSSSSETLRSTSDGNAANPPTPQGWDQSDPFHFLPRDTACLFCEHIGHSEQSMATSSPTTPAASPTSGLQQQQLVDHDGIVTRYAAGEVSREEAFILYHTYCIPDGYQDDELLTSTGVHYALRFADYLREESKSWHRPLQVWCAPNQGALHSGQLIAESLMSLLPPMPKAKTSVTCQQHPSEEPSTPSTPHGLPPPPDKQQQAILSQTRVIEWRGLRPMSKGSLSGYTDDILRLLHPTAYAQHQHDRLNYCFPQGEAYKDALSRTERIILELNRQIAPILIIAPYSSLRCVLGYFFECNQEIVPHLRIPRFSVLKNETRSYNNVYQAYTLMQTRGVYRVPVPSAIYAPIPREYVKHYYNTQLLSTQRQQEPAYHQEGEESSSELLQHDKPVAMQSAINQSNYHAFVHLIHQRAPQSPQCSSDDKSHLVVPSSNSNPSPSSPGDDMVLNLASCDCSTLAPVNSVIFCSCNTSIYHHQPEASLPLSPVCTASPVAAGQVASTVAK